MSEEQMHTHAVASPIPAAGVGGHGRVRWFCSLCGHELAESVEEVHVTGIGEHGEMVSLGLRGSERWFRYMGA